MSTLKEELDLYKMGQYSVDSVSEVDIQADNENIYINGNLVSGNIYNVLPSLKNSSFKDNVTIKSGLIHIDLNGKDSSIREYANNNLDAFYYVEYGNESEWEIEIVSETDKTCKISKVKQSNVKDNILRIPDYIIKNRQKYKVIGNNKNIIEGTIETKKIVIPETYTGDFEIIGTLGNTEIKSVKEVYIYNGCKELSYGLFSGYNNLERIHLPNTLVKIGGAAFWDCKKLKEIKLPECINEIGDQAFIACGITEITIPPSVTKVGAQLFQNCHSLKKVTFQNELLTLPKGTFLQSAVEIIQFPKNIEELAESSLSYMSLKEIDLPNTIQKIGNNAFGSNVQLEKIRIPNSVQEIGAETFSSGDSIVSLNSLTIYTDNQKFIQYMQINYPDFTRIKPYNEW